MKNKNSCETGEGLDGNSVQSSLSKSKMAGQLIWYNINCIISMQGFVWVIFLKKQQKLFVIQLS